MIRFVMVASLLVGCRISLEDEQGNQADANPSGDVCAVDTVSATCIEAEAGAHADLTFIEKSIFKGGCAFSGCHNGGSSPQGMVDLREGQSRAHLVDVASKLDPTRKLVVANDVKASYLLLMLRDFPPGEATPPGQEPPERAGFMPMGGRPLCCQKLAAIERWINAGAPSN